MYLAVVALTMFILPIASVLIDHGMHPAAAWMVLVGKWFVFWSVGVRLFLAGGRQVLQPSFTATEIFHIASGEALPLIQELGVANFAAGVVGLASILEPSFVLPAAISATIFYGVAGFRHIAERGKSPNETIAMTSDLFMFVVLGAFFATSLLTR
jgi:hypothetical protein